MNLEAIRNDLLRDVWAIQRLIENPLVRNVDVVVSKQCDVIDIVVDGQFFPLVTRSEIEDGTYRDTYKIRAKDVLSGKFGAPLVTR